MKGLCNVSEPHRGVDKEKAAITSLLDFDGLNMGQSHFANIDKSDLVARLSGQLSHHEHFHDFSRCKAFTHKRWPHNQTRTYDHHLKSLFFRYRLMIIPSCPLCQRFTELIGIIQTLEFFWVAPILLRKDCAYMVLFRLTHHSHHT